MHPSPARLSMQTDPKELSLYRQEIPHLQSNEMLYDRHDAPLRLTKGVVIHCRSAMAASGLPRYTLIEAPADEAVFYTWQPQYHIPSMVGLPLWTRNCDIFHDSNHHFSINQLALEENREARNLAMNGDLNAPNFGIAPMATGNLYVFRADGVDLLPQHLEALVIFCQGLVNKMKEGGGLATDPVIREEQRAYFHRNTTPNGFRIFFDKYCVNHHGNDLAWQNLPSPYDRLVMGTPPHVSQGDNPGCHGSQTPAQRMSFSPVNSMVSSMSPQPAQLSSSKRYGSKRPRRAASDSDNAGPGLLHGPQPGARRRAPPLANYSSTEMSRQLELCRGGKKGKKRTPITAEDSMTPTNTKQGQGSKSKKRKSATDSDDGAADPKRMTVPVMRSDVPNLAHWKPTDVGSNAARNFHYDWQNAISAVKRITPPKATTSPTGNERLRNSTTIEDDWSEMNGAHGAFETPHISRCEESGGNAGSSKDKESKKDVFQQQKEENQHHAFIAAQIIQYTDSNFPKEQSVGPANEKDKNMVSELHNDVIKPSEEKALPTYPSWQSTPLEYSEQERMAAAAASSKEGLQASHVLEPQRLLSEEELKKQERLMEEWRANEWVQEQGLYETGWLGPMWS